MLKEPSVKLGLIFNYVDENVGHPLIDGPTDWAGRTRKQRTGLSSNSGWVKGII